MERFFQLQSAAEPENPPKPGNPPAPPENDCAAALADEPENPPKPGKPPELNDWAPALAALPLNCGERATRTSAEPENPPKPGNPPAPPENDWAPAEAADPDSPPNPPCPPPAENDCEAALADEPENPPKPGKPPELNDWAPALAALPLNCGERATRTSGASSGISWFKFCLFQFV
uniref:Uncharacterized protein n=1 Tax=Anopheles atroparvus TaxID=41427 RepID=A0A182JMR1_ANOAO